MLSARMAHSAELPPYAPIRNYKSWRRMMTPVNYEMERRQKVGIGGSIPGNSKGLPQYPNRQSSQLPIQWVAELRR